MAKWQVELDPKQPEDLNLLNILRTGDGYRIFFDDMENDDATCLRELVADANRGAESAAYDKAIDDAAERATDEAFKLTPAALAHGLVRDAIGVLAGEHLPPGSSQHQEVPFALRHLAGALGCLNEVLVYEFHTTPQAQRPVPPQPLKEAIAEAHGLTPDGAEE